MFTCLSTGMIGISCDALETIDLAADAGFQGVDLSIPTIAELAPVGEALAARGLLPGCASGLLPGKTTVSDAEWDAAVNVLDAQAARAAALGFTRSTCVLLPFHETLPFAENQALHQRRLGQVAPMLAAHGIRLGLEYVSPLTRRAGYQHPFVHDLAATLELLAVIDQPNLGLLLDSFHWHCAGEDAACLRQLQAQQVVAVHLNDAIAGRALDEQLVSERELPGASGVIDARSFLSGLRQIDYDGPLTAEPMNQALRALAPAQRVSATLGAIHQVLAEANVTNVKAAGPSA